MDNIISVYNHEYVQYKGKVYKAKDEFSVNIGLFQASVGLIGRMCLCVQVDDNTAYPLYVYDDTVIDEDFGHLIEEASNGHQRARVVVGTVAMASKRTDETITVCGHVYKNKGGSVFGTDEEFIIDTMSFVTSSDMFQKTCLFIGDESDKQGYPKYISTVMYDDKELPRIEEALRKEGKKSYTVVGLQGEMLFGGLF